jgi:hypothetical protein
MQRVTWTNGKPEVLCSLTTMALSRGLAGACPSRRQGIADRKEAQAMAVETRVFCGLPPGRTRAENADAVLIDDG